MNPESPALSRRRLVIHGHVQGVGFRISCARWARGAGLAGWVRNLGDGSVELVLEGLTEAVADVEKRCRKGPPMARVISVDEFDELPEAEVGFSIR